ncbi:MAG: HNH endonuclease [Bacteroidaceae bacterium]|nr:HNH endonuclease [Bacteroidaceae bacterium]
MTRKKYIPTKPFPEFKWQWACLTPTESINDPVVLLGVLFRMAKLEKKYTFSSKEFHTELQELSDDIKDSIGVNLAGRGGERNLIRNSGQYWKALNLIPKDSHGIIELTEFGRKVALHDISQTEFSAITILTLKLPNPVIQSRRICDKWEQYGIVIYPLKLILSICKETEYITPDELRNVVIPLSADKKVTLQDYVYYTLKYRDGKLNMQDWPNCCEGANDKRMAREFLLFLSNYGYLNIQKERKNAIDKFYLNPAIADEILSIISGASLAPTIENSIQLLNRTDIVSDMDRKRIQVERRRPHQAQFRKDVLKACQRCIITNVCMPEVLEAAHIKPYKYHGEDTIANGFAMRLDIHMLFDTGHLRNSEDGTINLSNRARLDYGATIPPRIVIPDFINKDFLRWRWENYNGL